MRSLLDDRSNVLHIDLRHADVVLDDRDVVKQLKRCVGFFPNLNLLHVVRELGEQLMAVSSRGILAPSSTSEAETRHVLKCVTSALKTVHDRQPNQPPVVVLNGLNSVFFADHATLAQVIIDWAEAVTSARLAHVVILCDNNVAEDLEARPAVKTTLVTLEDGTLKQSAELIRDRLPQGRELSPDQLEEGVRILGGRLGDVSEGRDEGKGKLRKLRQ